MAKELKDLTKRSVDYSRWYNELVVKADLAEQSDVRGCMVIKPYGYAIWETLQHELDLRFKKTGVKKRVVDSEGREVVSRLDGDLLRQIALKTNGVYVPAGTGVLDLESVLQKHILPLVESSTQVKSREVRVELFQWFVGLGMLFFMGFMLLDARTNRKRQSKEKIA